MDENYISLERAIERMYEVTEECGTERIFIDRIIDELENLPSSPNICIHPQWIPVSERLPEVGDRCLCNVKSFAFPGSFYQSILKYDKFGFVEGCIYTDDVTHWMPLPEPPKEENR